MFGPSDVGQEEAVDAEYMEDLGDEDGIPPSFIALDTITESDDDQDGQKHDEEESNMEQQGMWWWQVFSCHGDFCDAIKGTIHDLTDL